MISRHLRVARRVAVVGAVAGAVVAGMFPAALPAAASVQSVSLSVTSVANDNALFRVTVVGGSGEVTVTCTSPDEPPDVQFATNNATSGQPVSIQVAALSTGTPYACVASIASVTSNSVEVTPASEPDPPFILDAFATGNALVLTVGEPDFDGGAEVLTYEARCDPEGAGPVLTPSVAAAPDEVEITVAPVIALRTYSCTVRAVNSVGRSVYSDPAIIDSLGPPTPPEEVSAVGVFGGVRVSFEEVSADPPVLSYTATCTPLAGGSPVSASGTASPLTVTGLTNGARYRCVVRAGNDVDDSDPSGEAQATAGGLPPAPTGVKAVPSGTGFLVTSAAVTAPGFTVTYVAACTSRSGIIRGSASTPRVNLPGAVRGVAYQCTMSARTAGGDTASRPVAAVAPVRAPAPTGLRAVVRGPAATLTWARVRLPKHSAVTSYVASCRAGTRVVRATTRANVVRVVLRLAPGRYTCTVAAVNGAGTGLPSRPAVAVVAAVRR